MRFRFFGDAARTGEDRRDLLVLFGLPGDLRVLFGDGMSIYCIVFLYRQIVSINHIREMRALFSDGSNSFFHFGFGLCTVYYPFIFLLFVVYQIMDINDPNICIDIAEYGIGMATGYALYEIIVGSKMLSSDIRNIISKRTAF